MPKAPLSCDESWHGSQGTAKALGSGPTYRVCGWWTMMDRLSRPEVSQTRATVVITL